MLDARIDTLLLRHPAAAGPMLLTLLGDVVAPRGGEAWVGNLIDTCAVLGINESRVRTALSRLAAAGTVEAVRQGRRSFYRLTPVARAEYAATEPLVYAAPEPPPLRGWLVAALPSGPGQARRRDRLAAQLTQLRFGMAQPHLAVLPDRGDPAPPVDAPVFRAVLENGANVQELVGGAWDFPALAARMDGFAAVFDGLDPAGCPPETALGLRLLLVHLWRQVALDDPRAPLALLPPDWPGPRTRRLFARLYLDLSPAADAAIAAHFVDRSGALIMDPAIARSRARAFGID